jgi:hypothetical protein
MDRPRIGLPGLLRLVGAEADRVEETTRAIGAALAGPERVEVRGGWNRRWHGERRRGPVEGVQQASRRIEDLVRELGVLGRFEGESDAPRAA